MSDEVVVSATEFAAFQADVDERFTNVMTQLEVLSKRISQALETQTVAEFPDEEAQIREKVLSAFQTEFANLLADLNTIKSNIVDLQEEVGIEA